MKQNKLLDAIGMIDDNLIEKADKKRGILKPIVRRSIISSAAAVLAVVITLAVVLSPQKSTTTPPISSNMTSTTTSDLQSDVPDTSSSTSRPSSTTSQTASKAPPKSNVITIATPTYPKYAAFPLKLDSGNAYASAQYKAWENDCRKRREAYDDSINLNPFLQKSVPQFFLNTNDQNVVYSPINVFLALGMLSEITDGSSRAQILDLLGYKDIDSLRKDAKSIYKAHYSDDGVYTSILSNSIWLNKNINYKKQSLSSIANHYYASSFSGEMGSSEYNKKFRDWLNSKTGGLLKHQINELYLPKDGSVTLASTIYFCSKWDKEFSDEKTKKDIFHGQKGDVTCDFLNQSTTDYVYYGDDFSAYKKGFEYGGSMYFVLPDENLTPEQLIQQKNITDLYSWDIFDDNVKRAIVNLSVPKFDVNSKIDLSDSLKKLGVTDVFSPKSADFSPLAQNSRGTAITQATHGSRVRIDEEGCEAVAYTVMIGAGSPPPPPEIIDFKLDRPFIFVITSEQGLPLFVGIVNQPN